MMKYLISLYLFFLSFHKIYLNTIFPSIRTPQELECINNKSPSLKDCTSIAASDSQYSCCYVKGVGLEKCGYLENTEYGIKKFKHIYSDYEDVEIECGANHINKLIVLLYLFFFIYI